MRFLGIYRERVFSPGRVRDDAAIMDETLRALGDHGNEIEAIEAETLDGGVPDVDCVLTMGQSDRVLKTLEEWRRRGVRIVNALASIRLCYRAPLMRCLACAGLPLPPGKIWRVEDAEERVAFESSKDYWVKRGDAHKVEPEDVVRVASRREFEVSLDHFRKRRIAQILVQEHEEGEVVKFYGVCGGSEARQTYFTAFPEKGDEEITGDLSELRRVSAKAAAAVGLEVYGGDAVITRPGRVVLIDLNAWPSFARCRSRAALHIAAYVSGEPARFTPSNIG